MRTNYILTKHFCFFDYVMFLVAFENKKNNYVQGRNKVMEICEEINIGNTKKAAKLLTTTRTKSQHEFCFYMINYFFQL